MAGRQTIVARTILVAVAAGLGVATLARPGVAPPARPAPAPVLVPAAPAIRRDGQPVGPHTRPAPAAAARVAAAPIASASPVAPQPLVVKRILPIPGAIAFGDYGWDEAGVPPGPIVITVDLAAQTLSVFRGGYEIGATAILYGTDDKPTPLGAFPITEKDADHVSTLYGAPMPYMLRLTPDGVSIHATKVEWGYGTHGCIGVPIAFAKRLFAVASRGDRVIITRGKSLALGQPIAG